VTEWKTTTEEMNEFEVHCTTTHDYNGIKTFTELDVTPKPRNTTSSKVTTTASRHHTTTATRHHTTTALSTSTHLLVLPITPIVTEYKTTTTTDTDTKTLAIMVYDYGTTTVKKVAFTPKSSEPMSTLANEADMASAIAELATMSQPGPIATAAADKQVIHESPSREQVERHCEDMCNGYQPCLRQCLGHSFFKLLSGHLIADVWR
jgi:hypothetical protein